VNGIVIDASVAAKWVVPEEYSEQAGSLRENALCAPAHWQAEAVNVIWSKVYRGELSAAEATRRARILMGAPVEPVPLPALMEEALRLSLAYRITIYDSLYLSLAAARDIGFVTAERKVLRSIGGDAKLVQRVRWVGDLER
jgi:predicted nucleic acid-binding protein